MNSRMKSIQSLKRPMSTTAGNERRIIWLTGRGIEVGGSRFSFWGRFEDVLIHAIFSRNLQQAKPDASQAHKTLQPYDGC